jgi:hypothetical protein
MTRPTDETLWAQYAAAALASDPRSKVVEAAGIADAMLTEHYDRFPAAASLPAPDVEGLSEADTEDAAELIEMGIRFLDRRGLVRSAQAIRAALLANGAGEVDQLRAELDEARRHHERCAKELGAWRRWCTERLKAAWGPDDEGRALIDAKLAAAKAGAVVTERHIMSLSWACGNTWQSPHYKNLRDLYDLLVQSREETGR